MSWRRARIPALRIIDIPSGVLELVSCPFPRPIWMSSRDHPHPIGEDLPLSVEDLVAESVSSPMMGPILADEATFLCGVSEPLPSPSPSHVCVM